MTVTELKKAYAAVRYAVMQAQAAMEQLAADVEDHCDEKEENSETWPSTAQGQAWHDRLEFLQGQAEELTAIADAALPGD